MEGVDNMILSTKGVIVVALLGLYLGNAAHASEAVPHRESFVYLLASSLSTFDTPTSAGYIRKLRSEGGCELVPLQMATQPMDDVPKSCVADRSARLLYVVPAGSLQKANSVQRFRVDAHGNLARLPWFNHQDLRAYKLALSPDGRHLLTLGGSLDTLTMYSISENGQLFQLSRWKRPPVPISGNGIRQKKASLALLTDISVNWSDWSVYALENHPLNTDDTVLLQLHISPSFSLSPISPLQIPSKGAEGLLLDSVNKVAYITTNRGGLLQYSIGRGGQLACRNIAASEFGQEESESAQAQKNSNGDLLPIPLTHTPKVSPVRIRCLVLDSAHSLLFGVGGIHNNEIDIWHVTSEGVGHILKRQWFDDSGSISETDAAENSNESGVSSAADLTFPSVAIGLNGASLYIAKCSVKQDAISKIGSKLYCFRIQQGDNIEIEACDHNNFLELGDTLVSAISVFDNH